MVRAIFPAPASTLTTLTWTSWSTSSSSPGSSMKPSLIWEMWTSPCAAEPPSGAWTSTKAPKLARPLTTPESHTVSGTSWKALRSATPRPPPPPAASPLFMERASLFAPRSTLSTRTLTSSPTATSSATFSTKPSFSCVMWTRPCAVEAPPPGGATATKAPKSLTLTTLPGSHSELSTPEKSERSARCAGGKILFFDMERVSLSPLYSTTHTVTPWPCFTTSSTFSTRSSESLLMGTRPCFSKPMSTKAPKGAVFTTTPENSWPGLGSPITSAGLNS
mmetsp:Transcript_18630/g.52629  ORF Transcript_18630/g.52629 Transcript_18630/m.52629 type:complete len:277 (+) Transcript_18630:242-1072(+)